MKEQITLKGYQTQINRLKSEVDILKSSVQGKQRELSLKVNQIQQIEDKMKRLSNEETQVSEHALLRYFERVLSYDLDVIKNIILDNQTKTVIETLGSDIKIPNKNGFTSVIKNNIVTTIVK